MTLTTLDAPMSPLPYRIRQVTWENRDTFSFALAPAGEGSCERFLPGQFNMLYVYGVGEVPVSISGDPAEGDMIVHTTRYVGNVTKAMSRLRADQMIGVRGPLGNHWPAGEAKGKDLLIVAGGIGLAPLRPLIYEALRRRSDYGKIVLLFGTRSPDDMLFRNELRQWRSRFDMDVQICVDRAHQDWFGHVGVVSSLIPRAGFDPYLTHAFICGPEIMMVNTVEALIKRGVSEEAIFVTMERNMKCGIGLCGHCQLGTAFICKDGPVFRYDEMAPWLTIREM
ncbi:MAG: FAD/NAD(P)-binding protein [Candidatus Hydrogenedentes bacterium]|nr:FAD/NAD(P)-binding protein [Candidatus Hydrogenedentota bacterium]